MKPEFQAENVETDVKHASDELARHADRIRLLIAGLRFSCSIGDSNSRQLDYDFDERLVEKLSGYYQVTALPRLDKILLPELTQNAEADLLIRDADSGLRIVCEIEKANPKTLWFDFIKIWMFIKSGQADVGLIIAPKSYVHRGGIWRVYDEAVKIKDYLAYFAEVSPDLIGKVAIIGYDHRINENGVFVPLTSHGLVRLKG